MANVIRITRSNSTNTPASLAQGELAFSENDSPNSIGELFIGVAGPGVQKIATLTGAAAAEPNDSGQDNQVITTGVGIDGADAGSATAITLTFAPSELPDVVPVTADKIIFQDISDGPGLGKTQAFSTVPLSIFNDDLGHVENAVHTGDVIGGTVLTIDALKVATGMIQADAVTYEKIQNVVADDVFLGNNAGAGGIVDELTGTEATAMLSLFATASTVQGLVPGSNSAGATFYLNGAGAWTVPAGGGDVAWNAGTAPADNALVRFDGVTGQLIQESQIIVDDADNVTGMGTLNTKTIADLTSDTDSDASGWTWTDTNTSLGTSNLVLPTQLAVKTYVDAAVVGGVTYQGAFDPTASAGDGSPDLDTITSVQGDMYTVTVAGTYNWTTGNAILEIGDVLIAESDGVLNDVADWTIVQQNLSAATISTPGYVSVGAQTFGGTKTFEDISGDNAAATLDSFIIDGGTF
jgi:hypothetical protein